MINETAFVKDEHVDSIISTPLMAGFKYKQYKLVFRGTCVLQ